MCHSINHDNAECVCVIFEPQLVINLADEEPGTAPTTPVSTPLLISDELEPYWLMSKPPLKKKRCDDHETEDVKLIRDRKKYHKEPRQ